MTHSINFGRLITYRVDLGLTALSGAMLSLTFPDFSYACIAWLALVPLLLQIYRSGYVKAFFSSLLAGLLFYLSLMNWAIGLNEANPYNFAVLILYLSVFFGLFGGMAKYVHGRFPGWDMVTFPFLWVAIEYVRSNSGFLSFPQGILGYSQYEFLPVARIAAYAGVYGVSFVIVAVNAGLASVFWKYLSLPSSDRPEARKSIRYPALLLGCVLLFLAIFIVREPLKDKAGPADRSMHIALVQGNAVADEKAGYEKYLREVFPTYEKLTLEAAASGVSLVVWPSSSVPGVLPLDRKMAARVGDIARRSGSHLLIGAAGLDKFNAEQVRSQRVANSAFLFSPTGTILGRYDKIHLLPFDEYLPARKYILWPSWIVTRGMTDHYPGKQLTLFQPGGPVRFGVQICFENMFPDQVRKLVSTGADFIVGQTNELYTKSTAAHYQNLAFYVFRAIENHVPVVRCSTNGISCFIDASGRIITSVKDSAGSEVDVAGASTAKISIRAGRTFYNRFGDLFSLISIVIVLSLGVYGLFRKPNQPLPSRQTIQGYEHVMVLGYGGHVPLTDLRSRLRRGCRSPAEGEFRLQC